MAIKRAVEVIFSDNQLDELAKEKIKALEKKIKSLEADKRKLIEASNKREYEISKAKDYMDDSKEKREEVKLLAQSLVDILLDADWATDYGGKC